MAFVLVQHLAPDHKSMLTDLIRRYTTMSVYEVEDGMTVQPDCAYIIPPNKDMAFLDGALHLMEPLSQRGMRLPIDFFFNSLALDQHERAICIILSGTGSDGTLGLRSVKGEGGMVMAQNPDAIEYSGMPSSAINTGLVDFVLTPQEMPAQLMAYKNHTFGKKTLPDPIQAPKFENATKKIFILLRSQTGHDFSHYKQNTTARRIERRMAVNQIENIDGYLQFLQRSTKEVDFLFRDMLIGVTSFFRDPDAFAALNERISVLFEGKPAGSTIRVWVCGCSTGEEAYSIAILLQEYMESLKQTFQLQVFATDIDSRAIETARAGIYPASIAADVTPERLERFFSYNKDAETYRIKKNIRDILIFSEQNIIKDPPFSKLDMISCRNMLIYMDSELQKKIFPLFHYALRYSGLLFLGNSESIGDFINLFTAVDRKWKLFQRKEDSRGADRPLFRNFSAPVSEGRAQIQQPKEKRGEKNLTFREMAEREMLEQYAPASALVNDRGEILYIHGRTGKYLEPAPGEVGVNILNMAREGLRPELTMALHKAAAQKTPVTCLNLRVKTNGDFTAINLAVRPIIEKSNEFSHRGIFLVVFEDAPDAAPGISVKAGAQNAGITSAGDSDIISALEQKLKAKEEYLQSTLEEMETSNEELKSTNEEMQSVNEELQSTNEELETSKEELQSVNEELATVNAELQQRVGDLSRTNNDINNLMAGTNIGTLFLDHHLRIQRFTPAAKRVINLIQTDIGRPIGDIVHRLNGYDRLLKDTREVLDTLIPKESEVQTPEGQWYQMRIQPYRTTENVIEGAVLTFVEITEMKRMHELISETESIRRLAAVVRDARDAVMLLGMDGGIHAWNPGAVRMYGWSEAEALGKNISELVPKRLKTEALAITQKLCMAKTIEPYRTERLAKDGRIIEVWLTATALVNESGEVYAVATTERAQ